LASDGPSQSPDPPAAAAAAAAEGPAPEGGKEELEDLVDRARVWALALAAALVNAARRFFDWVVSGDWMSWWPFWRPDRRLQRLIDDADAHPKDAAKQSALLHELNKFRFVRYTKDSFFIYFFCHFVSSQTQISIALGEPTWKCV
jgi:ATP-dependent metalloprotease